MGTKVNTNTANATIKTVEAFKKATEKLWAIIDQVSKDDREVIQKGLSKFQSRLDQLKKDELQAEAKAARDEKSQAKNQEVQALMESESFVTWWTARQEMSKRAVNPAGVMVVEIPVWFSKAPTSAEGWKQQDLWRSACRAKAQEIEAKNKARGFRVRVKLILTKPNA